MLLAFGACITFGFAPIDDYHLIVQNLAIRDMSIDGWKQMIMMFDPELYIPLTFLSFKIEALIFGMNPMMFHIDNLILHIINALLVAWIVTKLSGSRIAAWSLALIFAVHPLSTEAVIWISSRKDLLATFFSLLSIGFVLLSVERENRWFWILSIIFFICALLSKISVVLLPLFVLILLLRERFTLRTVTTMMLPYILAAFVLGIVALFGKSGAISATPLLERIIFGGYAIALSIAHVFIPAKLTLYYPVPAMNASTIVIACIPLLLLIGAILARKKSPLITLGALWFFLFILPTAFNIQTDIHASGVTFASDRYLYLPMIGLLLAMVGIVLSMRPLLDQSIARWSAVSITAIVLLIFVPLSRAQTATWNSASALFSHAVQVSPRSVQARIALAESLKKENKLQDAFTVLKQGLAYGNDERLHLEAGILYAAADDIANALQEFSTVLGMDPTSAAAEDGLAALEEHAGNTDEAMQSYEKSIAMDPRDADAHIALASLLLNEGKLQDADTHLTSALALDPSNIDALQLSATLFDAEGNSEKAKLYRERAELLAAPR